MLGLQDNILTVCLVDLFFKKEKEKIYLLTFLSTKIIFLLIKNFLMNFSKIKKFTTKGIVSVLLEFL